MTPKVIVVEADIGTNEEGRFIHLDEDKVYYMAAYMLELEDIDEDTEFPHPHCGRGLISVGETPEVALNHLVKELHEWGITVTEAIMPT